MAMCTALYTGHETYEAKVAFVTADLGKHTDDFDGIIASGMSGLMIAAPVSLRLGKTLGVVRHTDEKRHPGDHAGLTLIEKACFLDDFFGQGRTFRQCHEALKTARDPNTEISENDLRYYLQSYGEAYVRERWPNYDKPQNTERNIVAVYTYDKEYGDKSDRYFHVTSAVAAETNKYRKLWPEDVFEALRTGKKPVKQPVKQVAAPARDEAGRFAPKPIPVQKRSPAPKRLVSNYRPARKRRIFNSPGSF